MIKINKLPLAEEDLINIWIYGFEIWGIIQADTYADGIEKTLHNLALSPNKHPIRKDFRPPVRICYYVSHMIVYTIDKNSITIIRVLHKSMDVKKHL